MRSLQAKADATSAASSTSSSSGAAATHDLIKGASEDEKERLLSRNAVRIYGLGLEAA